MNNSLFSTTVQKYLLKKISTIVPLTIYRKIFMYESATIRITASEKILFIERLGLYLRSGITIITALSLISDSAHTKKTRYIFALIEHSVNRGKTLHEGLGLFPKVFAPFEISIIAVGEHGGTLIQNLADVVTLLKRRQKLQRSIISALIYPCIIVLGTIGVTLFLALFAFPKIIPLFTGFGTELPFPTRVLIAISTLVSEHGISLLLGLVFLFVSFLYVLQKEKVRRKLHIIILYIPILKTLTKQYYLAIITRTLSSLLSSGTSLTQALVLSNQTVTNSVYIDALSSIEMRVSSGQKLSLSLGIYPLLFPQVTVQLVSVGETTGSLSTTLGAISAMYEEELAYTTESLTTLIEPALMITMGLVVGFVALAIITPIYSITQGVQLQ